MIVSIRGKILKKAPTEIVIDVNVTPVPELQQQSERTESEFRLYFQNWLNSLWKNKDNRIKQLLES